MHATGSSQQLQKEPTQTIHEKKEDDIPFYNRTVVTHDLNNTVPSIHSVRRRVCVPENSLISLINSKANNNHNNNRIQNLSSRLKTDSNN